MIIAESFSIGCPVISSNVGNAADIVSESKGGIVFEAKSYESFIRALENCILKNKELSRNAFLFYKTVLLREKNCEALEAIYDSATLAGGQNKNLYLFRKTGRE